MRLLLFGLALLLAAPAGASAKIEYTFYNSIIPSRVDHLIGFTPTTFAIHPNDEPIVPIRVRVGGRTYRYVFDNAAAVVGPSADIYLRNMAKVRKYPSPQGVFLDRKLRKSERRFFKVVADLGRDADVLAAAAGHPACAAGVAHGTARAIASGKVTSWSSAGVPTPGTGNAIALRRAGTGSDAYAEPRFGAGAKLPKGAKAAFDGGLAEAAAGDQSIAAVTSWSRARSYGPAVCIVPVGGAAPTDESVRSLTHRDAYPITFVSWKNYPGSRGRAVRPITAAFVAYLTGARATGQFRQRGMLPAKADWPAVPPVA